MRRASRVDGNQAEIVETLRALGATVQHLHHVGSGCPDLLVGFREYNYLLEIKEPGGKLSEKQQAWHANWQGLVVVVRTAAEAAMAIGAMPGTVLREARRRWRKRNIEPRVKEARRELEAKRQQQERKRKAGPTEPD